MEPVCLALCLLLAGTGAKLVPVAYACAPGTRSRSTEPPVHTGLRALDGAGAGPAMPHQEV